MAWTRAEYLDESRSVMDAESSGRWTALTMRRHLGLAHQRLWRDILDAKSTYRWASREVTPNSEGRIALTALNGGTGDSLERFHRIITDPNAAGGVMRGDTLYHEVQPFLYTTQARRDAFGQSGVWWVQGENLQVLPVSTEPVTVLVSHTPARIDELAADVSTAVFPDGYELAVCYAAAALLLAKGGAEDDAGATMQALSQQIMTDLLGSVQRRTTAPLRFQSFDSANDWGL